eukprot:scaffold1148_cov108-Isochrysis_galbana.AAC.5
MSEKRIPLNSCLACGIAERPSSGYGPDLTDATALVKSGLPSSTLPRHAALFFLLPNLAPPIAPPGASAPAACLPAWSPPPETSTVCFSCRPGRPTPPPEPTACAFPFRPTWLPGVPTERTFTGPFTGSPRLVGAAGGRLGGLAERASEEAGRRPAGLAESGLKAAGE